MDDIANVERGSRLGPYEILDALGAGGMGEVFRARDTRLDREVAVKVLPSAYSEDETLKLRFEREAKMISQLSHPNICTLHDLGNEGGVDFLVMELCEGQSLADRLRKGPLPLDQALRVGIQISDALERAHAAGIIHRDLKPGNIILTRSGAKLLDFGLAKAIASSVEPDPLTSALTAQKPLTEEGTILGTYHYMAPEQLEGRGCDARTDIFALGVILYEMITGTRAFDGSTRASVIAAILERQPAPPSTLQPVVPATLDQIIGACLEKVPEERWQNALDLRRELEWLLQAPERVTVAEPSSRRLPLLIAAVVLAAVIASAATWLWVRSSDEPVRQIVSAISAPAGSQFVVTGDAAGPVTLSPDGRWVTFITNEDGAAELWVQSLESGSARVLPGTRNAMFPFWSPDSRSIGYFASGKLMAIDIDASNSREIANAPDGRGGLWGPDGFIIFTPYTQTGLHRVKTDGGPVTQITFPEPPYTTHRWPSLLAGGKEMIYLAALHGSPSSPETALFVSKADGTEPRKLLNTASSGVVYRDHLLWVRGTMLVAQRYEDGVLSEPAVPLMDGVLTDSGTWRSIVSVCDEGLLAAHPADERERALRLRWLDFEGNELGDAGDPAIYRDVTLSPDGEKLAMTVGDPNSQLYLSDLRRGVRTRFSSIDTVSNPIWTPDGKFLIFQYLMKSGSYEMMIKPADGSARERMLVNAPYALQPTSVDPKGGLVIFNALLPQDTDIMTVPLSGGEARTLLGGPGQQMNGVLSPDGRWLVYIETSNTGRYAYVTSYPDTGPRWQVSEDATYFLWWTKNGSEIRYLKDDGQIKSVAVGFEGGAVQFGPPSSGARLNVNTNRRPITMTAEGDRLIAATLSADDPGPATLITNFQAKLKP